MGSLTRMILLSARAEDFFKFSFHGPSQEEGVKVLQLRREPPFGRTGDVHRFLDSLIGRLR